MKIRLLIERALEKGLACSNLLRVFFNKDGVLDNSILTVRCMLPWCTLSFSFQSGTLEQATAASHTGKPSFNLLLYVTELFQFSVMRKKSISRK